MEKEYLSIGSVIELREKKGYLFMIIGLMAENSEGERRDYIAVRYPVGMLNRDNLYFLNHNQIEKTIYPGYVNEEHKVYAALLKAALEKEEAGAVG